jgi:peroxiredoxin Q/BCP
MRRSRQSGYPVARELGSVMDERLGVRTQVGPVVVNMGDRAPDFTLPDADMQLHTLGDFGDRALVLYFYPKDDTPGCTLQATEFSEMVGRFRRAAARVVGVSQDDCFSHQAFRDKYGLKIMLLSDMDGEACSSYGVLQEKEKNGVKRVGIVRSTFVIDRSGTVCYARYGVSPGKHAREMLEFVRNLQAK